jgi:phosphoglycerol transferase MdoB-like AlkP superfamily enzyme
MIFFTIKQFLKQYLFWMLFFAFHRLLFFIVYFRFSFQAGFTDVFNSFFRALYLDNSTAAYLLVFPFFILFFHSLFPKSFFNIILKYYSFFLISLLTIIYVAEIAIYNEWGIKLGYKALIYLERPAEILKSTRNWILISGILSIVVLSYSAIYIFKKFNSQPYHKLIRNWKFSAIWFPVVIVFIFTSMRGGLTGIPITIADAYFSKSNFVNQATVNTPRNLISSYLINKNALGKNPFVYFSKNEAQKIVNELNRYDFDSTEYILKTNRPNIVLIILESWSGAFIKELGGDSDLTPKFSELASQGFLFTKHYVSGTLSHQGMASIFSGFPNTPIVTITEQPEKYGGLPSLVRDLKKQNYSTSFLFGGELSYGNIKAYMYFNQFDHIIEGKDFPHSTPSGKLTIHDEYLYKHLIKDINSYRQPFFSATFTGSSHSPYDQPKVNTIARGGDLNGLFNSMVYADSCLYDFIQQAKKQSWYKNTLFIFVADHSHPSRYKYDYYSPEFRLAPLLFYGDVIKDEFKGKKLDKVVAQTDIPAILLGQMQLPYSQYVWSKNSLNPCVKDYAYYGFDDGFGWVLPNQNYVMMSLTNSYIQEKYVDSLQIKKIHDDGKAFLQLIYQQFIDF